MEPEILEYGSTGINLHNFALNSNCATEIKKRIKKHDIKTAFKSGQTISSLLKNRKDKVPRNIQKGVYKIPCSCGKFYVGRTRQNLENRPQQHKNATDCSLKDNKQELKAQMVLVTRSEELRAHMV